MNLIIGSHVSFKKDTQLLGSVEEAISYGANTFMFYTGAPQNTNRVALDDSLTYKAYLLMKENNIALESVVVHAPYIINLCNEKNFDFSVNFLKQEVERFEKLGIVNMVLHPGSAVGLSIDAAIHNIIAGLNLILDNDYNVCICLETMAGKGTEVGRNFQEIKKIIDGIKNKKRIGVCLDTCHINDSKNIINSHKDRHENIGFGTIGYDNLIKVIYNDRLDGIPKILETPYLGVDDDAKEKIYPPYKFEIEMIRNKEFNPNLKDDVRKYYSK